MDLPHENANLPRADDSVATMKIMAHPQTGTTEPASTDLLFSLPPELLLPIFSFVGVENFREDVRRLAVCKNWYAYAQQILLSSLSLHTGSRSLLPTLRAMERPMTLAAAQHLTKHIKLTLRALHHFSPQPRNMDLFIIQSLEELMSNFEAFAALRTLVIREEGAFFFLPWRILSGFATLPQLTSLEIDLAVITFDPSPKTPHLCESLKQRIPCLKRLRCRLPCICETLLQSPPRYLEELIIDISFRKVKEYWPYRCTKNMARDYNSDALRTIMETGLLQFARSMHNPKIVRLIHNIRHDERRIYAFDAIKNRRLFLGTSNAWDADGVLLPEDWDESDESEEDEESDEGEESDEWSAEYQDLLDKWIYD